MSRLTYRILVLGALGLLAACATGPRPAEVGTVDTSKSFKTVVVDAGHGGKDNGAYRKFGGAEKIATLDVAKRLSRKLRESDLKVVMTRSTDVFIPLEERVAIENAQKNSIFVSIHFNDSRRRGIRGFETYYHSGNSIDLATRIQSRLMAIPHSANRAVHPAIRRMRGAPREFSRAKTGEISGGAGRVRFSEQSTRGRRSAGFRISRSAGGQDRAGDCGPARWSPRNCGSRFGYSRDALKFFAAFLGTNRREKNNHDKNDRFDQRHGQSVIRLAGFEVEVFGQPRLLLRGVGSCEISKLISQSGKCSAILRRREFIQMHRDNAPSALHHKLNQEPADDQERGTGRKNPERNQEHATDRC